MLGTIFHVIMSMVGGVVALFLVCVALYFISYAIAYGVVQGATYNQRKAGK